MHNKNRIVRDKKLAMLKASLSLGEAIISISTNKEYSNELKEILFYQSMASYQEQMRRVRHTLPDNRNILDVTMMGSNYSHELRAQ